MRPLLRTIELEITSKPSEIIVIRFKHQSCADEHEMKIIPAADQQK